MAGRHREAPRVFIQNQGRHYIVFRTKDGRRVTVKSGTGRAPPTQEQIAAIVSAYGAGDLLRASAESHSTAKVYHRIVGLLKGLSSEQALEILAQAAELYVPEDEP